MDLRALALACSLALLIALSTSIAASRVEAARSVRVTEVTVPQSGAAAFAEAMRIALVRLTGRRDAAQDPALAQIVAEAQRYAQVVRPAASGGTSIVFDAAALERALVAAGQSVWSRERPVVLVAITQAPPGADAASVRTALEEAGAARGLPLQLVPAASAGIAAETDAEEALTAARRAGADAVLLGRAESGGGGDATGARWQWTLHAPAGSSTFSGGVAAGVHGAADELARGGSAVAMPTGLAESEAVVSVRGVRSLRDYVQVGRMLGAIPGVRALTALELDGEQARFRMFARGGSDGLATALAGNAQLRPESTDGVGLVLRFGP